MISAAGRKLMKGIKGGTPVAKPSVKPSSATTTKPMARVADRRAPEGPMQRASVRRAGQPIATKPMLGQRATPKPKPGLRKKPFGG